MKPRLYPGSAKQINSLDQGPKKSDGSKKTAGESPIELKHGKKKKAGGNFGTMSVIVVTCTKLTNHIMRNYSYEPLCHSVLRIR